MDFRLLGPFEVVDDGLVLSLGGRRQRAVLALLTIHAREVLSVDRIVEEIWAGSPPSSATQTLHAYVSRLRGALRNSSNATQEILVSRAPGYLLSVDESQVDSLRFENLLEEGTKLLAAGKPAQAHEAVSEALSTWRGMALADFAYEPFAARESQRLMDRRVEAVELRIDADLSLGRSGEVVAELDRLVEEHPLRERFWAQLMVALYRCGRQADALGAYSRIRSNLVNELGLEPGPELRRLERLVLEQSDELAHAPIARVLDASGVSARVGMGATGTLESQSAVQRTPPLPLVGRSAHLEHLVGHIHEARPNEQPRLVLVLGEAGCGKTRLLSEFTHLAAVSGVLVAAGSAERETGLPFGPFAEIVRNVIGTTGAEALERLGNLRPDLAWLMPEIEAAPSPAPLDLGVARTRLFEAVIKLLAVAGDAEPLLVVIDDAHRLESTSLVHTMLDRTWTRPVIFVMAYRTPAGAQVAGEDDPLIGMLRREQVSTLEVGRLTDSDLSDLLGQQVTPDLASPSDEFVRRLREQTAGIPLLVREVIGAGLTQVEPTHPSVRATSRLSPLVERVIDQRLAPIPDESRRVLELASIIGIKFDRRILADVLHSDGQLLDEHLDIALRSGIILETDDVDHYAFDHDLFREVMIAGLSTRRRIRLHALVAQALSGRGALVEAARHGLSGYATGMTAESAVALVLQAVDEALDTLDFEVGKTLCEEALSGPAQDLGPDPKADLFIRLGRAESLAGHFEAAEEAWGSAAALIRSTGDDERFADVALGTELHARMYTSSSELRWALLTEAMERLGPGWNRTRLLVATEWLQEAALPARRAVSLELANDVVEAAEHLGDRDALAAALHTRYFLARTSQLPERRQWCRDLRDLAEQLNSDQWLFQAYIAHLIDSVVFGDGPGVEEGLDLLGRVCARYRSPRALWVYELVVGSCARLRGEFATADEHTSTAARLGEQHGIADAPAALGAAAFVNAFHRGGLENFRDVLEKFVDTVPEIAAWTFGAGLAAAADRDYESARAQLDRGAHALTETPEELWLPSLCLAAELTAWIGAESPLLTRLTQMLEPYAGQIVIAGALASDFGPTDRSLGLLAAASGDLDKAEGHFRAALDLCGRLQALPWELRTRTDWLIAERSAGLPERSWWSGLENELRVAGLDGAIARLRTSQI